MKICRSSWIYENTLNIWNFKDAPHPKHLLTTRHWFMSEYTYIHTKTSLCLLTSNKEMTLKKKKKLNYILIFNNIINKRVKTLLWVFKKSKSLRFFQYIFLTLSNEPFFENPNSLNIIFFYRTGDSLIILCPWFVIV